MPQQVKTSHAKKSSIANLFFLQSFENDVYVRHVMKTKLSLLARLKNTRKYGKNFKLRKLILLDLILFLTLGCDIITS